MNNKGVVISSRFTMEELEVLQAAADRDGLLVSQYVREAALSTELRDRPGSWELCRSDGTVIQFWTSHPEIVSAG